ncbi:hypothetical protein HHK36_031108 [Tetracentron sinense]|uniref:Uncharacterized protein n=1 Tax=Tetracentron sinense TaxID=13715 RepID=A0A834YE07_TETSI|nr:hypothetical protein HHK36_031108 [Tetracentron sinense]
MTEKTDVVLHSLKSQKLCKVMDDALVQNVLQRLEALELSIHEIEQGLEDVLSQMNDSVQDLKSSLRRRKGGEFGLANEAGTYLISRKKVNKVICKCFGDLKRMDNYTFSAPVDKDLDLVTMVSMLREVEAITLSVFESLLSFVYGPKAKSKLIGWSFISKLMQTKRVVCEVEEANINEVHKVDVAVQNMYLAKRKRKKRIPIKSRRLMLHCSFSTYIKLCQDIHVVQLQKCAEALRGIRLSIQDLDGLECVFRRLIKTRVPLLNNSWENPQFDNLHRHPYFLKKWPLAFAYIFV